MKGLLQSGLLYGICIATVVALYPLLKGLPDAIEALSALLLLGGVFAALYWIIHTAEQDAVRRAEEAMLRTLKERVRARVEDEIL